METSLKVKVNLQNFVICRTFPDEQHGSDFYVEKKLISYLVPLGSEIREETETKFSQSFLITIKNLKTLFLKDIDYCSESDGVILAAATFIFLLS